MVFGIGGRATTRCQRQPFGSSARIFAGNMDLAGRYGWWNARCRSQKRQNQLKLIELDLPTLTRLVPEVRPDVPTNPEILDYDSNARVVDKVEPRRRSIRSSLPDSPRQKIEH